MLIKNNGTVNVSSEVEVKNDIGNPIPVNAADGEIKTLGTKADIANTDSASSWSVISLLKGIWGKLGSVALMAGSAVIGRVGIQVGGADLASGNPLFTDITDRATRSLGKVTFQLPDRMKAVPAVGVKTVSTTAADIFAGTTKLSGRYSMMVYNESSTTVYWGAAEVTTATGFPLLSASSVTFQFDTSTVTSIYFIATANSSIRVVELA